MRTLFFTEQFGGDWNWGRGCDDVPFRLSDFAYSPLFPVFSPCLLQFVHTSVIHHPVLFTPIDVDKWQCRQAGSLESFEAADCSLYQLFSPICRPVRCVGNPSNSGSRKAES